MTKLIEYTNEYNNIISERIQSENCLHTLKEQLSFEREYNNRCKQEFKYLEKIQYDSNNQFNETELKNIIQKIRLVFIIENYIKKKFSFSEDYQTYNEIQLSEFELSYKIKYDSIQKNFHQDKIENDPEEIKSLIDQNRSLQQQLSKNYID